MQMIPSKGTKLDLWRKATPKERVLAMRKPPHRSIASIRLILAIVAHLELELFQMVVKTAFLNGELDEKIYMDQPVGFVANGEERKVCKLR